MAATVDQRVPSGLHLSDLASGAVRRKVEAEDIVRVLAKVASKDFTYKKLVDGEMVDVPFDCEKAHAIAITILKDQSDADDPGFSFVDYMGTQDK